VKTWKNGAGGVVHYLFLSNEVTFRPGRPTPNLPNRIREKGIAWLCKQA
jgi:hypothetical protein